MNDCIFCQIIRGSIPCAKVYEDDQVLAFLDINPVVPGHTLLIPKEHYQYMTDVPDELLSIMFNNAKRLMAQIKDSLNADYVVLSVVGLDVQHFHIHLIPRYLDDGLAGFWPTKKYANGEMEEILNKLIN
jgi:histidine triad (HIT) family protein